MKQEKIPEHKQISNQRGVTGCDGARGRDSAEERLRAALQASGTGTFYWDLRTSEVDWDEGMERLFGLAPGRAPARAGEFFKFVHHEDVDAVEAALADAQREGADFEVEFRVVWPDGSVHWLHDKGRTFPDNHGRPLYVTGACVDITERKLADDVLHRYELLARLSRDVILFVRRDDGRILEANDAATAVYGYSRGELQSRTIYDLRAADTHGLAYDQMAEADLRGIAFETVHRRKDGSMFPVEVSSEGALIGNSPTLISVIRDISERKHAEEQLLAAKKLAERSLAQLRATIDSMSEGMFVIYPDGTCPLANPAFFRMYGFEPDSSFDAAKQAVLLLGTYELNGNKIPDKEQPVAIALRGKAVVQRELIIRRTDTGKEVITSVNATPVRDGSGKVAMAVVTVEDITAKKQYEKALIRSEKLAASGRLASMIAHEINNPLDAAMNLAYLLKDSISDRTAHERLDLLVGQLSIVSRITNQTLKLQRDSAKPTRFNLCDLIRELLSAYENKILNSGVSIQTRFEDECRVLGYSSEIRQVISNLLINALDATPAGGKITVHVCDSLDWHSGTRRGCRMTIADTGGGIDPQHRARLFEPFFTTKGENGTGLGLWVSSGIVSRAGGSLRVWSTHRPGHSGTCFSVFLPDSTAD
jgi:PAS domain S-box-containing protein